MSSKTITRRDFLKDSAVAAAGSSLFLSSAKKILASPSDKTKVVLIREENVIDRLNNVNKSVIKEMLDKALMELTNQSDPVKAWKNIIHPEDVIGVKTNVWSRLATPTELEESIKERLLDCSVNEDNIDFDDRGILRNEIFKKATALINVRPLRTHDWSGVGSLIKNYIMFVNNPASYHGDTCADLAKLWMLPHVKGKTRLNILVMLTPLYHGSGPHHFNPKHVWAYKGLLVGFDPVAVDATGVRILLAKRKEYFGEDKPINPPPKHVFLADTRHNLGTADPNKIELIRMGWDKDILI